MTNGGLSCIVCGACNGGWFTGHSNYVGPGQHVSTNKSCSIVKVHCVGCCKDPNVLEDMGDPE